DRTWLKMGWVTDRIIDAHVILKLENAGQVRDKVVDIILNVPGDTMVVKEIDKTFEASVDKGIDNLKRQLIKKKEKLRATH
ncbi:MAG TPA: HPF/RaiA family ribosome-associated protein, partial [Saprospiraceae bacterium]|nr:HPF/RaiA family ribosome-associated protein [Saprospiraceae bacterium]